MVFHTSGEQWRRAVGPRSVDVRAAVEAQRHHFDVTVLGRNIERRTAILLRLVQVGAAVDEQRRHGEVSLSRRDEKRRTPIVQRQVDGVTAV